MLKVIVTGAFSTGKSSLVEALALELTDIGLAVVRIPDVARTCRLPLNEAQTDATSLWLLTTQVAREIEAQAGPELVMLCDRGVPDILAHHRDNRPAAHGRWLEAMGAFPKKWIATYDVVLFSRIDDNKSIAADGLRSEDPAYRKRLDGHAAEILAHRAGIVTLAHDFSERLRQAREAIALALSRSRTSATL
ncbi:ATP-binding protein [Sphingobium sp. CFD-1]|uniref:ATP-binding protein n=1 Tax=Sphingobium sp. CFD-1 TaxID=2878545 RepID=UPI00214AFF46|nr:ATP-binding protein [Sphingobium sp. CFD-1]